MSSFTLDLMEEAYQEKAKKTSKLWQEIKAAKAAGDTDKAKKLQREYNRLTYDE